MRKPLATLLIRVTRFLVSLTFSFRSVPLSRISQRRLSCPSQYRLTACQGEKIPQTQGNRQIDAAFRRTVRRYSTAVGAAVPGVNNDDLSCGKRVVRKRGDRRTRPLCQRQQTYNGQQKRRSAQYPFSADQQDHHTTPLRDNL